MQIAVINYNMGNLHSVAKALEVSSKAYDFDISVTNSKDSISNAAAIVLPGVGAFKKGMENLKSLDLIEVIRIKVKDGVPFLGICLGLQLLFTESREHGYSQGLGLIEGSVVPFKRDLKVPHMGWNNVKLKIKDGGAKFGLLSGVKESSCFYFVHSYYVDPKDKDIVLTTTDYGVEFTSAIKKDNIYGVQFHPEKSGDSGLILFKNFSQLVSEVKRC